MSIAKQMTDKIADEQLAICLKDPNAYIECLVKFGSIRGLLSLIYVEYVTQKKITPLEALPEKNRRKIWKQAQADGAGRLTKENLIQLSKILYLIDFLLLQWELNNKKQL